MSKIKLALNVVEDLRNLADSIEALAGVAEGSNKNKVVEPQKEKPAPKITFEDLRAVLAVLTRQGKQEKVKDLITKYDAKKLSDVAEEHYHELLAEARKI